MPSFIHRLPGSERGYTLSAGPARRRCGPHGVPRVRQGPGEVDRGAWLSGNSELDSRYTAASPRPSYPRRRSLRLLVSWMAKHTPDEEPPWCTPPLPCAPGWTMDILYPWGVYVQAASRWRSPMAGEVVDECLPAYWRHPGMPCSQEGDTVDSGLSMRVEAIGMGGDLWSGRGRSVRQWWWQNSLQRITSQVSHLISGECRMSQGHSRMMSTVGPTSTRNVISSLCRVPTLSFKVHVPTS